MPEFVVETDKDLKRLKAYVVKWSCDVDKECYTLPLLGFLTTYQVSWRGKIQWFGTEDPKVIILTIREKQTGLSAGVRPQDDTVSHEDASVIICQLSIWLLGDTVTDRHGFAGYDGNIRSVIEMRSQHSVELQMPFAKCIYTDTWNALVGLFDGRLSLTGLTSTAFLVRLSIKDESILHNCECPEGYYVKELALKDALFACKQWKFSSYSTEVPLAMLKSSIVAGLSMGAFTETDNELVSWGFVLDEGCIGSLQTTEGHRRRGLASVVVKQLCKRMLDLNMCPIAFIENNTVASLRLFEKLGFTAVKSNLYHWGYLHLLLS